VRRPTGPGVLLAFIRLVFLAAAVLLASAGSASAGDARIDAARAHSAEGDAYYKLEKYANAIAEYEQAYLAKPDPSFLYNIAQCHRLMGHGAEAIKFYRRYLKDAPAAPNRAVAEKHIRDLEDASAHGPQPPASPSVPVAPSPTSTAPPPVAAPTEPVTPLSSPPSAASSLSAPAPTSTPVSTTPIVENGAAPPQSDQSESHPIYSRWWFWTAIGAAVVGGIVLIAVTRGGDPSCPTSTGFKCQ
jgi:tetratricopeptide (TPR) repeat protein